MINVDYGCGVLGIPISSRNLYSKKEPKEIKVRRIKKEENCFLYIPLYPVKKGYYLIDYKLNGQSNIGWNPLVVIDNI